MNSKFNGLIPSWYFFPICAIFLQFLCQPTTSSTILRTEKSIPNRACVNDETDSLCDLYASQGACVWSSDTKEACKKSCGLCDSSYTIRANTYCEWGAESGKRIGGTLSEAKNTCIVLPTCKMFYWDNVRKSYQSCPIEIVIRSSSSGPILYIKTYRPASMCPATHPFVFRGGRYCCKTNEDFNGSPLQSTSGSCKNSGYVNCLTWPCSDYKGTTSAATTPVATTPTETTAATTTTADPFFFGNQGQHDCPGGAFIRDQTMCKRACTQLVLPLKEIFGGFVCYKDYRGYCFQNGQNGGGASMVCEQTP